MSNPLENHLLFHLDRFSRMHRQCLAQKLSPYDIRPGQIPLLMCLWQKDGVHQKELLGQVDVEQPTLANTLKRMERDGLVGIERDPDDQRKCIYRLSELGRKARTVVEAALADVQTTSETGLSVNDIRYFRRILNQMTERLRDDLLDPALILADEVRDAPA